MADAIKVTVLRQKVLHDGLSMLVLKPGADNPPVPLDLVAGLVAEGTIDPPEGWEAPAITLPANLASADGPVFSAQPPVSEPITTDLVRLASDGPSPLIGVELLENQSLGSLIAIAAAEGVIPDAEEMRLSLVDAIRDKRAGVGEFGQELLDDEDLGDAGGEGEAPLPTGVPQEGEPLRLSDEERAKLPQLDHDGDGNPGGDKADDELALSSAGFTLTDAGGGWWHITGPGLDDTVKVRGEDAAKARFDELVAAAAEPGDAGGEGEAPA